MPIQAAPVQVELQVRAIPMTCFTKIVHTHTHFMEPRARDGINTARDGQKCGLQHRIARVEGFEAESGGIDGSTSQTHPYHQSRTKSI